MLFEEISAFSHQHEPTKCDNQPSEVIWKRDQVVRWKDEVEHHDQHYTDQQKYWWYDNFFQRFSLLFHRHVENTWIHFGIQLDALDKNWLGRTILDPLRH